MKAFTNFSVKKLVLAASLIVPISSVFLYITPAKAGCIQKQQYINGQLMYLCKFRSGVLQWVRDPYNECQKVCNYQ